MKNPLFSPKQFVLPHTGKMCFGVAAGAFLTAALGFVVNQFLVGWLATGGMIAIGLLYVAMGLLQIRIAHTHSSSGGYTMHRPLNDNSQAAQTTSTDLKERTWNFPSDFETETLDSRKAHKHSMTRM
jgi:hypothetical protein